MASKSTKFRCAGEYSDSEFEYSDDPDNSPTAEPTTSVLRMTDAADSAVVNTYRPSTGQLANTPMAERVMGFLELQERGRQTAMSDMAKAHEQSAKVLTTMVDMAQDAQNMRHLKQLHPEAYQVLVAPRKRDKQKRRRMKNSAAKAEAQADAASSHNSVQEHNDDGPQSSSHEMYMAKLDTIRAKCSERRDSSGTPPRVGAAKLTPRRDEYGSPTRVVTVEPSRKRH